MASCRQTPSHSGGTAPDFNRLPFSILLKTESLTPIYSIANIIHEFVKIVQLKNQGGPSFNEALNLFNNLQGSLEAHNLPR